MSQSEQGLEQNLIQRLTGLGYEPVTIRNADRIYVMERGHLVEQGQHEELVAQQGIYAGLWNLQTGQLS